MSSHILRAISHKLVIYPVVVVLLLVLFSLLDAPRSRPSAQKQQPAPLQLCATPRARIDLVLPPIDFVPTKMASALIGEKFKFEVTFDNNLGNGAGFGPYLDVIFPASGIDGGTVGPPLDGISLDQSTSPGASYLGTSLQPNRVTRIPFPSTGSVIHPFTLQPMTGTPGDELVVIELPFGSYTPQQAPASIIVNALVSNLADIDDPLTINVQAGFRYGCSPTGNSGALVSIPANNDHGTVTPVLFTIDKTYDGPEIGPKMGETATGPNFPHRYTITVNVATGQTVINLIVTDLLPNNLAFKGLGTITQVNGPPWSVVGSPPSNVATSNGILAIKFPSITGTPSLSDVSVQFEFFIPDKDASGALILNPTTGAAVTSENNAKVEGNWTPLDPRDPSGLQVLDPNGPEYTLVCKSIALQKSGINTSKSNANVAAIMPPTDNAPGDIILWDLNLQVSDYFTFNQLTIEDIISDGQFFLTLPAVPYAPKFTLTDQLHNVSGSFPFGNPTATGLPCSGFQAGRVRVFFTLTGSLTGGLALSNPSPIPAQGKVTFYTRIQEDYLCPVPSGDFSVDQNDKLYNRATIKGTILNNSTLQPIGPMQDDATVDFKLLIGVLSKSIYAHTDHSGVVTLNPPATQLFAPGDKITFRLMYKLPHGDIEKFAIEDFLPQPVLKASELTVAALSSCGGIPAAGTACFGPLNTVNLLNKPVFTTNVPGNSAKFDYGTFDDPASPLNGKVIDILFTLTIQNDPFVDGLFLTNQIQSSENNSFNETTNEITIAQFLVAEPNLRIRKGVVETNNTANPPPVFSPSVTPPYNNGFVPPITSTILSNPNAIHSNLSNVDAGDLVTFAIVVENLGSSPYGVFDIKVSDTMPPGFVIPTLSPFLNLKVMLGSGLPIIPGSPANFFTTGIDLPDPSLTQGSLVPFNPISGKNIAVITYTLQLAAQVAPCQTLPNTATIKNYSSSHLGPNYATSGYGGPYSDTRAVKITQPTISKAFISTNQPYTSGTSVTIGEEVTYDLTVTLPEGVTPSLTVTDPLPPGLQAISVGPVSGPVAPPAPGITPAVFPGGCGAAATLTFGAINVLVDNNPLNNWFKFQLKARVCNVPGNVGFVGSQTTLSNTAIVASGTCQNSSNPVPITVVEPKLKITKQFTPNLVLPNGTVQIKLVVTNSGTSPAFDVVVEDPMPNTTFLNITSVTTPPGWGFAATSSGLNTTVTYTSQPLVSIPPGGTVTFIFKATVKTGCGVLTNTAKITHATTLLGVAGYERDEPPTSGSAGLIIQGVGCPCTAVPPNLVDWWSFNELTGTIANDIRGSVNNSGAYGPGSSSPTPTPGVVKNALCFDGVNDYVDVGLANDPEINFLGSCGVGATAESFTIDVWVKTSPTILLQVILDKRTFSPVIGYHMFIGNGLVGFQMNGMNFVEPPTGPNVADGQWHFIAVTVARCQGVGTLYVDGAQVLTFTPPLGSLVNSANLQIGRSSPGFGLNHFNGCLDELEIFKRALSATEIKSIYAAGSGGKCNAGCPAPIFKPVQTYLAHTFPSSLVAVDFNGDGKLDLAVGNQTSLDVSVLSGTAFAPPINYSIGASALNLNGLAVGSFNSQVDSTPDFAVITYAPNPDTVRVLASPSYGVSQTVPLAGPGPQPQSIVVGQFNTSGVGSDSFADLAVANFTAETVVTLKGSGNATFTTGQTISLPGHGPTGLVVAKFISNSGFDNLIVTGFSSGKVIVLNGNGNGTFTVGASFNSGNAGNKPFALTAADFNHDQKLDLAVVNSTGNNVAVFLGNGVGQFTLSGIFPVGTFPRSVAVGDFNCDGELDLVVANRQSNTVSVLLGNGQGGFGAKTDFNVGGGPNTVVVGDFDGDGKPDIATANPNANNVSILLNDCACPCFLQGVTLQPSSQKVCLGGTATFSALAIGSPSPAVQWQVSTNGGLTWTNISGATSTTLTVTGPAGLYQAVFTNACGTATSSAASLSYTLIPCLIDTAERSFPPSGGSGSVNVNVPDDTAWTATSNASWITITSGSSGIGRGTVNYTVAGNGRGSPPRTGTMKIAGKTFTVRQ